MKRRAGGRPSLHPKTPDRSGEFVLARRKFPASPAAKTTMPPARPAVNPAGPVPSVSISSREFSDWWIG